MFGIKRRFQWCKVWPPRFKEFTIQMHQIWVPRSKRTVSATVVQSSKRTVADRHRLAAHHNKHSWRAFQGYRHRWPWTTLNPKIGVFSDFFCDLRLPHTFQEWTASESPEIDKDNLQMKFSALNVDFNSSSFDPLGSRSPAYECIKFGYPLENVRFLLLSTNLAWERLQIDTDLLRIIHKKHCWWAFWGYQHRWPWTSLNPKNIAILVCDAHLEWIFAEI